MTKAERKIVQYLDEAHASELALTSVLRSQILMTPRGSYRSALEKHLQETRGHARRLEERMSELGRDGDLVSGAIGLVESVIGQTVAIAKTPLDLLRGSGGEEKVLKNAKDTCATEALEIATYTAIEQIAAALGDEETRRMAVAIRREEERMLGRVMRELPRLADAVVGADVRGNGSYEISQTGAADAIRDAGRGVRRRARSTERKGKRAARSARRVPGVARVEGQVKGAVSTSGDLAIGNYDELTASEIAERLPGLSQVELARIETYERRHQKRSTILSRIETLKDREPWPGYDDQTVEETRERLSSGNEQLAERVRAYERTHKKRSSLIDAAERERQHA
jgi:ferritin-like metal-binding protein YciE